MKLIIVIFLQLILVTTSYSQVKLIKASGYLDIRQGKIIRPANILIDSERILSVNPEQISDTLEVIDLGEMILMPGLIDAHVHLESDFGPDFATNSIKENQAKRTLKAVKNAEKTLLAGFTTVRSCGQIHYSKTLIDVALSEASDANWIRSPRIVPSGQSLSITGGHGDFSMFPGIAEGILNLDYRNGVADGVDEVTKSVRYQIKNGAKWIKVMATAGVFSNSESLGNQQYTYEELKAIADEAARHDVHVAAHAHGTEGIKAAIKAGVKSIEHGSILDEEAVAMMKKNNVFLGANAHLVTTKPHNYERLDPVIQKKLKKISELAIASYKMAIKEGVTMIFTTDAPLVAHGENAKEFIGLTNLGMKPIDAIRTATLNNAKLLGMKIGEIEEDYFADIIAVSDNPLVNIETLLDMKFIMKGGQVFKNSE